MNGVDGKNMGSVSRENYNVKLMNIADYSDLKQLKNLYINYNNILELAKMGDSVALSIIIDLREVLRSDKSYVTDIQRMCIKEVLINRRGPTDVANEVDRDLTTITGNLNGALKRVRKILMGGELYIEVRDRPRFGVFERERSLVQKEK